MTEASIGELQIGDRFHFAGDWQTEPGDWCVTRIDDLGFRHCACTDGLQRGITSSFFGNVTVERHGND